MGIYLVLAAAIICCALTVLLSRRYVRQTFDSIDRIMDRVLLMDRKLLSEITDESRISKLTCKARRIMDLCISEAAQAREEKDTVQGFISDMSHQMKTPLSGISMYADLLLEGSLTEEERREFLSRVKSGADKLQWMMDSLIKMSRLEVGAIQLSPVSENIGQTVSDAIGSVIAAAAKKNINLSVSDFHDMPLYHDRKWTREAIANILENAVKYSAPDSEITISLQPMPLYTTIMITDHGIGIDKSDWNLIFKRFYRGREVSDKEGAGLGLYLSALIMEKQGGYIMVDSVPGQYTSFSLFLQNSRIESC
ncbi:signal transduction histidine kinase [Anaerotaenia torta]|uniref:sensor histidine kinase n=1 Tax=Anaerotaenia torta TaxID=433293 RepID=UPI003D19DB75